MEVISNSPAETEELGAQLAARLAPGSIVAFTGDLGAGKTAFTRGLARGLGVEERVTSPTFTIVNEYEGGRLPLIHFDMYCLGSSEELFEAVWGEKYDPARSVKITGFKLAKRPASKAETIRFSGAAAKPLKKDFAATTAEFFPPHPNPEKPYPTFSADPSNGAEVLAKYSDGSAAFAKIKRGERTCYFVSIPIFKAETYRKIFDAAGVRAPAPAGCAVYADSRFTAFFPSRDAEAKLSGKAAQKDLFTGEKYAGGQTVKLKAGRALILETEE